MSAPTTATPSRELVRILLCAWRHDYPRPRGQRRALDEMRAELRERERAPVAPERYQLGPVPCDPFEDPFCETDGEGAS